MAKYTEYAWTIIPENRNSNEEACIIGTVMKKHIPKETNYNEINARNNRDGYWTRFNKCRIVV